MAITINITGENMADIIEQLGAIYSAGGGKSKSSGVVTRPSQPEVEAENTGSSGSGPGEVDALPVAGGTHPAPIVDAPAKGAVSAAVVPPAVAPQSEATVLDYAKDVSPFLSRIISERSAAQARELLQRFKVKKGGELPLADLPVFLEQAKAILGETA